MVARSKIMGSRALGSEQSTCQARVSSDETDALENGLLCENQYG
jgi:hypothetical protein